MIPIIVGSDFDQASFSFLSQWRDTSILGTDLIDVTEWLNWLKKTARCSFLYLPDLYSEFEA